MMILRKLKRNILEVDCENMKIALSPYIKVEDFSFGIITTKGFFKINELLNN